MDIRYSYPDCQNPAHHLSPPQATYIILETKECTMSDMTCTQSQYWGKRDRDTNVHHLLIYHNLDVAAVGRTLVKQDPALSRIFTNCPIFSKNPDLLPFLLALHDVGKYTAAFQEKIQQNIQNGADHTAPGRTILITSLKTGVLDKYLRERFPGELRKVRAFLRICIDPITGHHGKPPHNKEYVDKQDQEVAEATIQELITLFRPLSSPYVPVDESQAKYLSWPLAGLCVLSDWLASDPAHFPWSADPVPLDQLDQYWSSAKARACSLLAVTGLVPPPPSKKSATTHVLFGFDPRPLQETIEHLSVSSGPSLTILEEATGGGKTEAALLLAYKLIQQGAGNGIYFALPTMATANAMYERITAKGSDGVPLYERYYSGDSPVSIVLAHGQRIFSQRYRELTLPGKNPEETWIYDNNKKCLLASIGVGTIDQALMGVLPWKHQSLRLLGVCRNILIVDEVHAYDSYTNRLLELLLTFQFQCGGSAILLSATLPANLKEKFVRTYGEKKTPYFVGAPYPVLTRTVHSKTEVTAIRPSPDKTTTVRLVSTEREAVSCLVDVARGGGCTCWVRNTVNDALAAYHLLKQECPDLKILLFHARFTMGDRLVRENEVLSLFGKWSTPEMRKGCILIATQVVEQSLDLDFDLMVSDLAPIDLIIQRAGRVWRHVRVRSGCVMCPELCILSPVPSEDADETWYSSMFSGGAYVYPEHGKLWKTARIFQREGKLSMPSDARRLIDEVYSSDGSDIPAALRELDERAQGDARLSSGKASQRALHLQGGYVAGDQQWTSEEPALTRDSDDEQVVLELWRVLPWDAEDSERYLSRSPLTDVDEISRPWDAEGDFPNARSQVRVRRKMLPKCLCIPKDHVLRVFLHQEGGEWICRWDEEPGFRLVYSSDEGLSVPYGNSFK